MKDVLCVVYVSVLEETFRRAESWHIVGLRGEPGRQDALRRAGRLLSKHLQVASKGDGRIVTPLYVANRGAWDEVMLAPWEGTAAPATRYDEPEDEQRPGRKSLG